MSFLMYYFDPPLQKKMVILSNRSENNFIPSRPLEKQYYSLQRGVVGRGMAGRCGEGGPAHGTSRAGGAPELSRKE